MSKPFRFGVVALPLLFGLITGPGMAQVTPPQEPAGPVPAAQAPPPVRAAAPQPVASPQAPPPKDPSVLEDGGLYFQPMYWINKAQPSFHGGKTAVGPGNLPFTGDAKASIGGEIGIPAGRSNTLRVSYFRTQGNSAMTLGKDTTILSQGYVAGDYVAGTYKTQAVKVSWDYLSYTWRKPTTTIHLKTLYEFQYVTTKLDTAAPFKAVTADASGNTNDNTASGSKSVVLPTFGMAIGSQLGKYFRWDLRGSGFGLPHKSAIGSAEASIAVRLRIVELVVGEKFFYFKTSPGKDLYVTDTMQGVFGGLRFAWRGQR